MSQSTSPGTSRQRLLTTLSHRQPDRVCVDFGATPVSGMHVSAVTRLRRAVLNDPSYRVRVIEPYQMLGEIDDALADALGIDVMGASGRKSMFGTENKDFKPFVMNDGTEVLVPGNFVVRRDPAGDCWIYPEGDVTAPPSGHMPAGGCFFDAVIRQPDLDEQKLDPRNNLEEFGLLDDADWAYFRQVRDWFDSHPHRGRVLNLPGTGFGDIAQVPAPFLKHPKGIRDVEEWYVSTAIRQDYVLAIFQQQCLIAEQNILRLIEFFGDRVDVAMISGTDFGTQRGPFVSLESFRRLFKPFQQRLNGLIHSRSKWKTFIHSCGSVYDLIPEFIDAGFDILNPVQCSAAQMDPARLKRQFGSSITFWGAGVDTQKTMAFGTPDEVYRQVRQRIEIFGQDGGFVFNGIHNIQAATPNENMLAMFRAIRDSAS